MSHRSSAKALPVPSTPPSRSRRLKTNGSRSLVEVKPVTGRSHQIRVQLASRGWPILGDAKYGSSIRLDGSIALHASSLTFRHPTKGEEVTVVAGEPLIWAKML